MGYGIVKSKSVHYELDKFNKQQWYVPDSRCNLHSVTCLIEKGCKTNLGNNYCMLMYDKDDE